MNIVEPFLYQCRYNAHAAALCLPGANDVLVSYGRLARLMNNVSRKALHIGLAPGNIVAIFVGNPILHSALILGLTQVGIVTLSGRNPILPRELPVDALIADSFYPYQASRIIVADQSWTDGDGAPLAENRIRPESHDDVCRIILTSGTTGEGKAVALSHANMAQRIARHIHGFGSLLPHCMRTYCNMDFGTSLGFQFLIYTLWHGGTLFISGSDLQHVTRAFQVYEVQNMLASPAGLASHLRFYEEHPELSCGLDMILTAGSLLSSGLAERVRARMCGHVVSLYGATEIGMVATAPAHVLAHTPGAVGHVMPDTTVQIVDDKGESLPQQSEGVVRVRSSCMVSGYVGDPPESAAAFANGWFYPGDLGRIVDDGLLVISGRTKSVMNLGGDKVKPELIEEALASHSTVDEAGVFGVTNELGIDEVWALVVPRTPWNESAVRAHCEMKLPMNFVPSRFIVVESLPKNASGKLERRNLISLAHAKLNA